NNKTSPVKSELGKSEYFYRSTNTEQSMNNGKLVKNDASTSGEKVKRPPGRPPLNGHESKSPIYLSSSAYPRDLSMSSAQKLLRSPPIRVNSCDKADSKSRKSTGELPKAKSTR